MSFSGAVYDDHADWYADIVRHHGLIHLQIIPQIMDFIGDVFGQRVADVGCGEGVFSRELTVKGAQATGIDLSRRLLAIAVNMPHDNQPAYIRDDARSLSQFSDSTFDGATCIMAMMDIDDIGATFHAIHRVTRPGGWLVVVITHPCFESPRARTDVIAGEPSRVTTRYLTEGPWRGTENGVRSRCGAQHRTMSTYLNTAIEAGWILERMVEPRVTYTGDDMAYPPSDHPGLLMLRFQRRDER